MSYQQNNQQYGYDDGKTKMCYSSTQVAYNSGAGQQMPTMPPMQMPQLPMMDPNFHQNALTNHINLHSSMVQGMGNMSLGYPHQQQMLPPGPQQIGHSPQPQQGRRQQLPPQKQSGYVENDDDCDESSSEDEASDSFSDEKARPSHSHLEAENRRLREQYENESRHLRSQLEREKRHNAQLAESYRNAASTPKEPPSFDTAALGKIVETIVKKHSSKSSGPSREEMTALIQQACAKQMEGLAKKEDIRAVAVDMEAGLRGKRGGASRKDVERAVQAGIQGVMDRSLRQLAGRQQQLQQQRLEAPGRNQNWQNQRAEFEVEEVDEEPVRAVKRSSKSRAPKAQALEPAYQTPDTQALTQLPPTENRPAKTSVAPSDRNALVKPKSGGSKASQAPSQPACNVPASTMAIQDAACQPLSSDTLARIPQADQKASKMAPKSVAPGDHNALTKPEKHRSGSSKSRATKALEAPPFGGAGDSIALVKSSKRSSSSKKSAAPSEHKAMVRVGGDVRVSSSSKSAAPGDGNALVESTRRDGQSRLQKALEPVTEEAESGGQLVCQRKDVAKRP